MQGKITHAEGTEGSGVYVENGALKLYGGSITGNNGEISSYLGSGVYVGNGKFNMYGGSITGNKGGSYCLGGGVYVTESSEFHMYGGAVSDNNAGFGGGVEASGTFRMCGGSITGNTATYGGGVYVREGGTFTVSGNVTVTGNTAIEKTNNVYLSKATLIGVIDALTGGASIGVTTAEPPTKDSPVTIVANPNSSDISELIKRITSDNTAYEIAEKDNTIVLKAKDDSTPTKKGEQAPLTLSASKTTLTVGETLPLTVTGGSTNGTVTYQVSDTSVANINNHILTANKVGTVEVTATMSGDETYSDVTSNSITITITEKSVDPTPTPTPNPGTGGNTGSNGGNSSSSSSDRDRDPSYAVSTPAKTEHGTVTVSPKSASQGDRVTLTVTPDSGYVLDELTVTDSKGNELKLTNQGGGKYTFSMPNGKVEVKAGFVLQSAAQPFGDVASDAYYAEAVKWAVENGITNGKANGLFGSNDPCTRGQIVTFLWRAAGSPASKGTAAVPADVIPGSYCYDAIAWAIENGITNGLEDGSFGAGGACTRAQCVALLFRSAVANGLEAVTLQDLISGFGDAAELPAYAVPAMNWALSSGIVQGNGGLLLSNVACTRAQIVTFLWRLYTGK